jgi:hypothetical protein
VTSVAVASATPSSTVASTLQQFSLRLLRSVRCYCAVRLGFAGSARGYRCWLSRSHYTGSGTIRREMPLWWAVPWYRSATLSSLPHGDFSGASRRLHRAECSGHKGRMALATKLEWAIRHCAGRTARSKPLALGLVSNNDVVPPYSLYVRAAAKEKKRLNRVAVRKKKARERTLCR